MCNFDKMFPFSLNFSINRKLIKIGKTKYAEIKELINDFIYKNR